MQPAPASPVRLELFLLGRPEIRVGGQPLLVQPPVKGQALIFYLAATRRTLTREALAGLFWGEMDGESARANLRLTLSRLQKLVGPCLLADRREVRCNFDWPVWVDVHEFATALSPRKTLHSDAVRASLNLYRSEFLHDFSVDDVPEFEMWVLGERERLHRLALEGLQTLLQSEIEAGALFDGINTTRRMLDLEPWHEEAHRLLMWLLNATGQRSSALTQYEGCCRILEAELGVPPDTETVKLYEQIKSGSSVVAPGQAAPAAVAPDPTAAAPLAAPAIPPSTPAGLRFVGRSKELHALHSALLDTLQGSGRQLFVVGGAGRGKSSLAHEFSRRAQSQFPELLIAFGHCSVREGIGDPYLPFRTILQQLTGDVRPGAGGAHVERTATGYLARAAAFSIPLLLDEAPDLIGSFVPAQQLLDRASQHQEADSPLMQRLTRLAEVRAAPQVDQPRLFVQIATFLAALAARHPLVLVMEDLHWADASSISLLFHLCRTFTASRILVFGTYRPDEVLTERKGEQHPLAGILGELKRLHGQISIDLAQQTSAEERAFVDAYLDAEQNALDESFRSRLFRHTGGHPLFVAETLRELQERDDLVQDGTGKWVVARPIDWTELPAKVEGVIEQRLVAVDKDLRTWLALAAVEGEIFTAEAIAAILHQDPRDVVRRLSQELGQERRLVQAYAIEYVGEQRLSRFRFSHQLFQHYLYNNLSAVERAYYHEDIGNTLETLYGPRSPESAGVLADHFHAAGAAAKALRYMALAAQQAMIKTANVEAAGYARTGLGLLDVIPPGVDRLKLELLLQIVRGRSAMYIEGYAASDAEAGFARALHLCEQMGRIPHIFPVMQGLWGLYTVQCKLEASRRQAQQFIALATDQGNASAELIGQGMLAVSLYWLGALAEAHTLLQHVAANYQPAEDVENIATYGQAVILGRLAVLPVILATIGSADQARSQAQLLLQLSDSIPDPIARAVVLSFGGVTYQLLHDIDETHAWAEATIAHCEKVGIPFWLSYGMVLRGWVQLERGNPEGLALLRTELDALRSRKELVGAPWQFSMLALGLAQTGQPQAGLDAGEEGLALSAELGDIPNQVLLQLARAEILLMFSRNNTAAAGQRLQEAEESLLGALELARTIGHKLGALRAAIDLYRLWHGQEKAAVGIELLREIYASYDQGFDTFFMREAAELLAAQPA